MTILNVRGLTVKFGGLTAVNSVSFDVPRGTIFSVIGPNGAGKTTVFNSITGLNEPTSGWIDLHGAMIGRHLTPALLLAWTALSLVSGIAFMLAYSAEQYWETAIVYNYVYLEPFPWGKAITDLLTQIKDAPVSMTLIPALIGFAVYAAGTIALWMRSRRAPEAVSEARISRTFQNIRLFPQMSVLDNVLVGMDNRLHAGLITTIFRLPSFRRERSWAESQAREALQFVGLSDKSYDAASALPYGQQRRLEIARALASDPELLLLDEPAAGMNPTEAESLMLLIRAIKERGITVMLIEHHMKVVMGISERIVVLDYGNKIAEGTPEEIRQNPKVIEAYLGKDTTHA